MLIIKQIKAVLIIKPIKNNPKKLNSVSCDILILTNIIVVFNQKV